jgi:hypothetical protein
MVLCKSGGNLVMQYNTNQDTTVDQLGMYNFSIANKRVTEENAEVTVFKSQS